MRKFIATEHYAEYGEVKLFMGRGYALRFTENNSAPCGKCAFFNNNTHETERMCGHPKKEQRECKHETGTEKGWNTTEYIKIPEQYIKAL